MARETPLLPEGDAREAALFFVVVALCFLAALAALTMKATYAAAESWTASVEGEYTIRLKDTDRRGAEAARDRVAALDGVASARILTREEVNELLAPSFAGGELPAGLPMPLVMAVQATPDAGPGGGRGGGSGGGDGAAPGGRPLSDALADALAAAGVEGVVDAHDAWAGDVRRTLSTLRIVALATVMLLGATALSVIAFATHAALLARRDIVDVLHLCGATDRFISRLFERRFWTLGLRAGSVGALLALGGVALALSNARTGGTRGGLLPTLELDPGDGLVLLATPVVAALAARIAARLTVMRALKEQV